MEKNEIIEGNKLIAEFVGYVQSEYPVYLHGGQHGFGYGKKDVFINKYQYAFLTDYMKRDDVLLIDEFYEQDKLDHSYKFDGVHLFLTAFKNRSTKLDSLGGINDLKYHSSWDWLMPVVEKIESMNFSTEINFIPGIGHLLTFVSGGAILNKSKAYPTKIEAVWSAVVAFINWYNKNQKEVKK